MLQALLADRFKLLVQKEPKQVAGYCVELGKGGSSLVLKTNGHLARAARSARTVRSPLKCSGEE
jgi:uncharacterized protein (TIGR03435 family)